MCRYVSPGEHRRVTIAPRALFESFQVSSRSLADQYLFCARTGSGWDCGREHCSLNTTAQAIFGNDMHWATAMEGQPNPRVASCEMKSEKFSKLSVQLTDCLVE